MSDSNKDMTAYPALAFIVTAERWTRPPIESPHECCDCPFATAMGTQDGYNPPNPADPGEGYYRCALLDIGMGSQLFSGRHGEDYVWGEDPVCTSDDWAYQAQREWATLQARLTPPEVV